MRVKYQSAASYMPPTEDPASNPGMCPDQESNQQPSGTWDDAQPTDPHQPGPKMDFLTSALFLGRILFCRSRKAKYMRFTSPGFVVITICDLASASPGPGKGGCYPYPVLLKTLMTDSIPILKLIALNSSSLTSI
uniref:Uncharacterized protein n=1 Tax=Molossus molossus TaxID=27622 RepID=A0A7J8FZ61_MOLMO|nr:hypothetical protein HJG59_008201 [Molossus molossus]